MDKEKKKDKEIENILDTVPKLPTEEFSWNDLTSGSPISFTATTTHYPRIDIEQMMILSLEPWVHYQSILSQPYKPPTSYLSGKITNKKSVYDKENRETTHTFVCVTELERPSHSDKIKEVPRTQKYVFLQKERIPLPDLGGIFMNVIMDKKTGDEYNFLTTDDHDHFWNLFVPEILKKIKTKIQKQKEDERKLKKPIQLHTTTFSFDQYKDKNKKDTCVICLYEFKKNAKIRKLRCNHFFHIKCIDQWIINNPTCPCCRKSIIPDSKKKNKNKKKQEDIEIPRIRSIFTRTETITTNIPTHSITSERVPMIETRSYDDKKLTKKEQEERLIEDPNDDDSGPPQNEGEGSWEDYHKYYEKQIEKGEEEQKKMIESIIAVPPYMNFWYHASEIKKMKERKRKQEEENKFRQGMKGMFPCVRNWNDRTWKMYFSHDEKKLEIYKKKMEMLKKLKEETQNYTWGDLITSQRGMRRGRGYSENTNFVFPLTKSHDHVKREDEKEEYDEPIPDVNLFD